MGSYRLQPGALPSGAQIYSFPMNAVPMNARSAVLSWSALDASGQPALPGAEELLVLPP